MRSTAKSEGKNGRSKSLRSKVVSTLLSVFILYAFVAWFVLEFVQTPAFDRIESVNASDQVTRVHRHIEAERSAVDLMVLDWAQWDDAMEYALGINEGFREDNLTDANLSSLGMSFGAVIDSAGKQLWGEAYQPDQSVEALESLFPTGIQSNEKLLQPEKPDEIVSGLIQTTQGLAIVSSAAILWNSGEGAVGGHFILGRLLESGKMESVSQIMLTPIDLLPVEQALLPHSYHQALDELSIKHAPFAIVKQANSIYALKLLRDITGEQLAILRVELTANISMLGANTVRTTISILVLAALLLTITLWIVLNGLFLSPIERLTAIFRSVEDEQTTEGSGQYLLSTVRRLTDSRGLITRRDDEIGELIGAFDDLSSSLASASSSVWRAAHLDGLTGLANRRLFMERLSVAVNQSDEESAELAVLFIDLDDFKIINDRFGHNAGDQILIDVAARINSVVGVNDVDIAVQDSGMYNLVARIGGDEFVVLLKADCSAMQANKIASGIVETIATPFVIGKEQCQIGACVGLALYPEDASDVFEVLSQADAAMYEAKRAGKNSWRRYVPGLSRFRDQKSA